MCVIHSHPRVHTYQIYKECAHMYITLQHTATHCNTLQHTATHCNILQHTATYCATGKNYRTNGNRIINGGTCALKNPGIGTDYFNLMAMIHVKEFRNQGGVAAYKAASSKTAD